MALHLFEDNPKSIEIIEINNKVENKFYNFRFNLNYDKNIKIYFEFNNSGKWENKKSIQVKTDNLNIDLYSGHVKKSKDQFKFEHIKFLNDTKSSKKNYYSYILAIKTLYIINKVHENYSGDLDFSFLN